MNARPDFLLGCMIHPQRQYQQKIMSGFYDQGIEEMRFVRLPYSGKVPTGHASYNASDPIGRDSRAAFTANTQDCMEEAFKKRSVGGVLSCWSTASARTPTGHIARSPAKPGGSTRSGRV